MPQLNLSKDLLEAYRRALRKPDSQASKQLSLYDRPPFDESSLEQKIYRVARHEAAHAVVSVIALGSRPIKVTIEPTSAFFGCMYPEEFEAPSVQRSYRHRRERRVMMLVAGMVSNAPDEFFQQPFQTQKDYFAPEGDGLSSDIAGAFVMLVNGEPDDHDDNELWPWNELLRLAWRTHTLLGNERIKKCFGRLAIQLLVQPTLLKTDLDPSMNALAWYREDAWTWMKAQEKTLRPPVFKPARRRRSESAHDGSPLLIAIGDLHGHYPALVALLDALQKHHGIFDGSDADALAPGVTLVFTGDYIDRGNQALKIISRLSELARASPGRVITLFGNHELLALECLDKARELVSDSDDSVGGLREYEASTVHGYNGGGAFVREFGGSKRSAALAAYVERMGGSGDIGSWMRSLLPWYEAQIGNRKFLFTHGDFSMELLAPGVLSRYKKDLLQRLAAGSAALGGTAKKYGHAWLKGSASFFWCRSFRRLEDATPEAIESICDAANVDYIVTGHTPHPGKIMNYGGRIFDIDVGMTPDYGTNTPHALVISEDRIVSFRVDGKERELAQLHRSTS